MKITIDMEMTPEEARKMMGLPDLEPLQAAIMEKMQQQTEEYLKSISDPETIVKKFMPMGLQAMEQYSQLFTPATPKNSDTPTQEDNQK